MQSTTILKIDPENPDPAAIAAAAELLRQGKLVAFPTETVYGLGANALDAAAIDRIYWAKQRPAGDPVIAHIYSLDQLDALAVNIPQEARLLAEKLWPGPLTMVLQRHADIPQNIAANRPTVAVRMPAHPVARALLEAAQIPVAAPSANAFSRPSATTAAHVMADLGGRVEIILDGGSTHIGLESTVVDMTGDHPVVLRPGGIVFDDLKAIIPTMTKQTRTASTKSHEIAPGQMLKHYSPDAQVILYDGTVEAILAAIKTNATEHSAKDKRVGLLLADEDIAQLRPTLGETFTYQSLGSANDLGTISHGLFAALRTLDAQQVDIILTRGFGHEGLGAALWDRLMRSAEGHIINAS